jgi:hypothetical protein
MQPIISHATSIAALRLNLLLGLGVRGDGSNFTLDELWIGLIGTHLWSKGQAQGPFRKANQEVKFRRGQNDFFWFLFSVTLVPIIIRRGQNDLASPRCLTRSLLGRFQPRPFLQKKGKNKNPARQGHILVKN